MPPDLELAKDLAGNQLGLEAEPELIKIGVSEPCLIFAPTGSGKSYLADKYHWCEMDQLFKGWPGKSFWDDPDPAERTRILTALKEFTLSHLRRHHCVALVSTDPLTWLSLSPKGNLDYKGVQLLMPWAEVRQQIIKRAAFPGLEHGQGAYRAHQRYAAMVMAKGRLDARTPFPVVASQSALAPLRLHNPFLPLKLAACGDVHPNPGPQRYEDEEGGIVSNMRTPVGTVRLGSTAVPTPAVQPMGGVRMLPTQAHAYLRSSGLAAYRLSSKSIPRELYASSEFSFTGRELYLDHNIQFTRDREYKEREILNYRMRTVATSRTIADSQVVANFSAWPRSVSIASLQSEFSSLETKSGREFKDQLYRMTEYHAVNMNNYRDIMETLPLARRSSRYVTFMLKAWLDYFTACTVASCPVTPTRWQRSQVGGAAWPPIANIAAVNRTNDWPAYLQGRDEILRGDHFWCEVPSGADANEYVGMSMRYASSWPPYHVSTVLNAAGAVVGGAVAANGVWANVQAAVPAAAGRRHHLLAMNVAIPGYASFTSSHGIDERTFDGAPGNPPALARVEGWLNPDRIRAFIRLFAQANNCTADAEYAFELATILACGTRTGTSSTYYRTATGNGRTGTAVPHRTFNGFFMKSRFTVPRDLTGMSFFNSFMQPTEIQTSYIVDLTTLEPAEFAKYVGFTNAAIQFGWSCAFKACTANGYALAELHTAGTRPAFAYHMASIARQRDHRTLTILQRAFRNAMRLTFGWTLSREIVLLHSLADDNIGPLSRHVSSYCMNYEVPLGQIPYAVAQYWVTAPDWALLPFTGGVVKWPADKALPVRTAQQPLNSVRLGRTMAHLGSDFWVGDGGAEYSAQYYVASNGNDDDVHVADGSANVTTALSWVRPNQYQLPAAPSNVGIRRYAAPFADYMRAGSLTAYNATARYPNAFGMRLAAGATSRQWLHLAMGTPNVAPRLALYSKYYTTTEMIRPDYALYVLEDDEGPVGVALQPISRDQIPRYVFGQDAKGLSGPAAEANDNNPDDVKRSVPASSTARYSVAPSLALSLRPAEPVIAHRIQGVDEMKQAFSSPLKGRVDLAASESKRVSRPSKPVRQRATRDPLPTKLLAERHRKERAQFSRPGSTGYSRDVDAGLRGTMLARQREEAATAAKRLYEREAPKGTVWRPKSTARARADGEPQPSRADVLSEPQPHARSRFPAPQDQTPPLVIREKEDESEPPDILSSEAMEVVPNDVATVEARTRLAAGYYSEGEVTPITQEEAEQSYRNHQSFPDGDD